MSSVEEAGEVKKFNEPLEKMRQPCSILVSPRQVPPVDQNRLPRLLNLIEECQVKRNYSKVNFTGTVGMTS